MSELKNHPAADLFPLIDGEDFDALVADIAERGLEFPIVLCDEMILDGRNRHKACTAAGVEPKFIVYTGRDPYGYVISANLKRRHLSASQRAMVAAKLAKLSAGRPVTTGGSNKTSGVIPSKDGITTSQAAQALNVSEKSVERAKEVAQKGTPELVKAVEQGAIPVTTAAEATALPKPKQKKLVKEVQAGRKPAEALKQQQEETRPAEEGGLLDALGLVVPEPLATHWVAQVERHARAAKMLRDLGKLLSEMGGVPCGEVWATSLTNEIVGSRSAEEPETRRRCADLRAVEARLRDALPWVSVCPYCHHAERGPSHADCTVCHGWGYVTKQVWKSSPPDYRHIVCDELGGKEP